MIITVPLTGTILEGKWEDGTLKGDPSDPVRPIPINLGNVSWVLVDINEQEGVAYLDISPGDDIIELNGEVVSSRKATPQEKADILQNAKDVVNSKTKGELIALAGTPPLKGGRFH